MGEGVHQRAQQAAERPGREGPASMRASLQPLAAVLRVHPQGGSYEERADYGWSASVSFEPGPTARIHGAERAPRPSEWRAIRAELCRWGMRRAVWERHTLRGDRDVVVRLDGDG